MLKAASSLRLAALTLARSVGRDALVLYARRLARIESESTWSPPPGFEPMKAVESARTWADLQHVQA